MRSASRSSSIRVVAEGPLCCGCGTCAYLEPDGVTMVDVVDRGLRPHVRPGHTTEATTLQACPGVGLRHESAPAGADPDLLDTWGPVLGIWEGWAADADVRWSGSSAGAATVLATHCLENEGMAGVVHVAAREDRPWQNRTVFSTSRAELEAATGSRYAPASPCDLLGAIEAASAPCVFIGKPCDVAGAQAARRLRPALDANLGLTIGIFCAGTPSTAGTLEMLAAMGVPDPQRAVEVRYRGRGWPGPATVTTDDGATGSMTYDESWGRILQRHRQWRCYVCADHTGEFADIAVGDPWYHELTGDDPGRSLIVARTHRGRAVIQSAIAAGLLVAEPVDSSLLPRSQPNLERTRGAVWARVAVTRLMGVAAPRYSALPTFHAWRRLTAREKVSSVFGTARRVFRKRLHARRPVPAPEAAAVGSVPA